jgi:peptide/nickel transport system permease protein
MLAFVVSRIAQAIPVLLAVAFVAFVMFAFVGDPTVIMLGQSYTEAQRQALVAQLGLDQPFLVQYAKFIWAILHGDLGISYRLARPVADLMAERIPATIELALTAFAFALVFGLTLGLYTAIHSRSALSRVLMALSLIGASLPNFLVGILLILCFSVSLGWLPSFGRGEVVHLGDWWTTGFLTRSGLRALILPSLTLGLFPMTLIMRLVRSEMLEVLRSDYIRFARARGLPDRAVYLGHALKNTLVPVITIIGLQLGGLIAFSIVTETVFQWPGLGLLFVQSVVVADIPVISAYLLIIAALFMAINLAVDLLYYIVDPRLRAGPEAVRAR